PTQLCKSIPTHKMAAKKSFVLRMEEATYAALEKWAADEFRSVNGQLEWMIDKMLREAGRSPRVRPALPPNDAASETIKDK
ncbi:MAG: hypothetical protein ACKVT2_11965, partial [Saprospiraceae bacterium]